MRNTVEAGPVVDKYGGFSTSTAESISLINRLVRAEPDCLYVVVSAPGRRYAGDTKISDLLDQCYFLNMEGKSFDESFEPIVTRFEAIAEFYGCKNATISDLDETYKGIKKGRGREWTIKQGEATTGPIVAHVLDARLVDPRTMLFFDKDNILNPVSYKIARHVLSATNERMVIPGYFGSKKRDPDGIGTFGRGGSDATGAFIARVVRARLYRNWTNTPVRTADPNRVPYAQIVRELTYSELAALQGDVSVFQPEAVIYVSRANIPTVVKDFFNPDNETRVENSRVYSPEETIVGIAGSEKSGYVRLVGQQLRSKTTTQALKILEAASIRIKRIVPGNVSITIEVENDKVNEASVLLHDTFLAAT